MVQRDELTLEGTWIMESAFEIRADGVRITTYGERPAGLLMIDRQGRYSLQIFRRARPHFASGDKTRGRAEVAIAVFIRTPADRVARRQLRAGEPVERGHHRAERDRQDHRRPGDARRDPEADKNTSSED